MKFPSSSTTSSDAPPLATLPDGPAPGWGRMAAFTLLAPGLLALGLLVASLALDLEPEQGNMTRLGGFTEKAYGPNAPQPVPAQPYTGQVTSYAPCDVLVLGDSFSQGMGGAFWQRYFLEATGLSVLTLELAKLKEPRRVLGDRRYQAAPPRLVVLEVVEQNLAKYFGQGAPVSLSPQPEATPAPFTLRPAPGPRTQLERPRGTWPWRFDWRQTQGHLAVWGRWALHGEAPSQVTRLTLRTPSRFSSRVPVSLLVHRNDLAKAAVTPAQLRAIASHLLALQQAFEADGRTRFALLVAPDKLTAYGPDLADPAQAVPSLIPALAATPWLHVVRTDLALRAAIGRGGVDVYQPNDTHWGPAGHEAAAGALVEYLRESGAQ